MQLLGQEDKKPPIATNGDKPPLLSMPRAAAKSRIKVLHLEDNEHDQIFVQEMLRVGGLDCELVAVKTSNDFEAELRKHRFDLIISDYSMPSFDGLSGLEMARKLCPEI